MNKLPLQRVELFDQEVEEVYDQELFGIDGDDTSGDKEDGGPDIKSKDWDDRPERTKSKKEEDDYDFDNSNRESTLIIEEEDFQTFVHPLYDESTNRYDIMLIHINLFEDDNDSQLESILQSQQNSYIKLNNDPTLPINNQDLVVVGWGVTDADDENWEDQIAKRAGVTSQNDDEIIDIPSRCQSFQKEHGTEEVSKIKHTITSAIENISQQQLDLESAIVRKKHDAQEANKEATAKEKELADFGRNFEYYQSLRSNFADWIGALRYLSQRIDTIENAVADLYQDSNQWKILYPK